MKILITGAAGFIGFHFSSYFLKKNYSVIGVDSLNDYYDVSLKKERIKILKKNKKFEFIKGNLIKKNFYKNNFKKINNIKTIIHLAGQAGVRNSFENPEAHINNNIIAYINLLEFYKKKKMNYIFYASSSSVYGDGNYNVPLSIYAASKINMEHISKIYSTKYTKNIIGIRFFTVFGPFGRPDMAYFKFLNLKQENKSIEIYNYGKHKRSFTFIDDLCENFYKIFNFYKDKKKKKINSIYNIGNPKSISLKKFITEYESVIGEKFKKKYIKMQIGDAKTTKAIIKNENKLFNFKFSTNLNSGLKKFLLWYKKFYKF